MALRVSRSIMAFTIDLYRPRTAVATIPRRSFDAGARRAIEPAPMDHDDHLGRTRAYYDEFAARYEERRDGRDPGGYHDLLDELEVGFVERYGRGRDVLEVGCGT